MATAPLFSRRYVSWLIHWLGWGLLGYLLFFSQPFGSDIRLPHYFWVKQVIFFCLTFGTFYLNAQWMVPQLLLKEKTSQYIMALLSVILTVLIVLGCVEIGFDLPTLMHRSLHLSADTKLSPYRWIQPALFTVVLVLGISTSIALMEKWQRDINLRLALEQAKTASELSFLKAQINPHFFFNTLNNIYALTSLDVELAQQAIHRLSRMMRYVLYETQTGTTLLSKELSFVGDYVQLMQLRLTDKVTVTVDTPLALQDLPIAPMILVPFVENAFKHGVSARHSSLIRISIQQQQRQLLLDVRNTLFIEKSPSLEAGNGIGLTNTRRRLDLLYPGQYTLCIDDSNPAGEYQVQLTLTLS